MSINLTATATCPDCRGVISGEPAFVEAVVREHRTAHADTRADLAAQIDQLRERTAVLEAAVFPAEQDDEPPVDDVDDSDEP
jgi:hypothetical protein